jgi:hypothetical protein
MSLIIESDWHHGSTVIDVPSDWSSHTRVQTLIHHVLTKLAAHATVYEHDQHQPDTNKNWSGKSKNEQLTANNVWLVSVSSTQQQRAVRASSLLSIDENVDVTSLVHTTISYNDDDVAHIHVVEWPIIRVITMDGLKGGKGGFGALLRNASMKPGQRKNTNNSASRDLNGRRLRHVEVYHIISFNRGHLVASLILDDVTNVPIDGRSIKVMES